MCKLTWKEDVLVALPVRTRVVRTLEARSHWCRRRKEENKYCAVDRLTAFLIKRWTGSRNCLILIGQPAAKTRQWWRRKALLQTYSERWRWSRLSLFFVSVFCLCRVHTTCHGLKHLNLICCIGIFEIEIKILCFQASYILAESIGAARLSNQLLAGKWSRQYRRRQLSET